MQDENVCNSCGQPKAKLKAVKSKVIPDIKLLMCQTCIDNKYEPRWCLILAGRSYGPDCVKAHINKRKYHGETILFSEIVK